jgi:hypothetical protein
LLIVNNPTGIIVTLFIQICKVIDYFFHWVFKYNGRVNSTHDKSGMSNDARYIYKAFDVERSLDASIYIP